MNWEKIIIAVVSAAFAAILYILLPIESNKYRLRLEKEVSYSNMFAVLHSDLDGDGDAEFIRCKKQNPVPAILTQSSDYRDVRQWNLNGEWLEYSEVKITDLDHDGVSEIIGNTSAPRNVKDPLAPYSDSCAWFMIYDQDLCFKLPPLPYFGAPSYFYVMPLKAGNRQLLLSLHFTRTRSGTKNLLELWGWKNDSLTLVRSREFAFDEQMELVSVDPMQNGNFYLAVKDQIIGFNLKLEENDQM